MFSGGDSGNQCALLQLTWSPRPLYLLWPPPVSSWLLCDNPNIILWPSQRSFRSETLSHHWPVGQQTMARTAGEAADPQRLEAGGADKGNCTSSQFSRPFTLWDTASPLTQSHPVTDITTGLIKGEGRERLTGEEKDEMKIEWRVNYMVGPQLYSKSDRDLSLTMKTRFQYCGVSPLLRFILFTFSLRLRRDWMVVICDFFFVLESDQIWILSRGLMWCKRKKCSSEGFTVCGLFSILYH